jgi:hypothetical protein
LIRRELLSSELTLTPLGAEYSDRLIATVRERLEKLLDGWDPDTYPDLVRLLDSMSVELASSSAIQAGTGRGELSS